MAAKTTIIIIVIINIVLHHHYYQTTHTKSNLIDIGRTRAGHGSKSILQFLRDLCAPSHAGEFYIGIIYIKIYMKIYMKIMIAMMVKNI